MGVTIEELNEACEVLESRIEGIVNRELERFQRDFGVGVPDIKIKFFVCLELTNHKTYKVGDVEVKLDIRNVNL